MATSVEKRQKLAGKDNWSTWSAGIQMDLERAGVWDTLTAEEPKIAESYETTEKLDIACREWLLEHNEEDTVSTQKVTANRIKFKKYLKDEHKKWKELSAEAKAEIYHGCSAAIQHSLLGKSAGEAWKYLKKIYAVTGTAAILRADEDLQGLTLAGCKSLQDYISRFNALVEKLDGLGMTRPQPLYIGVFIRGLGSAYNALSREIQQRAPETLDLTDVTAQAFAEESLLQGKDRQSNNHGSALKNQGKEKGPSGGNNGQKGQQQKGAGNGTTQPTTEWMCRTHSTNKHTWSQCPENPFNGGKGGRPNKGPTKVYADNKSAIALANNPVYHARSRHIDIQHHYVREKVADNTIDLIYVPTAEMAADGLTKPLDKIKFGRFMEMLGMVNADPG